MFYFYTHTHTHSQSHSPSRTHAHAHTRVASAALERTQQHPGGSSRSLFPGGEAAWDRGYARSRITNEVRLEAPVRLLLAPEVPGAAPHQAETLKGWHRAKVKARRRGDQGTQWGMGEVPETRLSLPTSPAFTPTRRTTQPPPAGPGVPAQQSGEAGRVQGCRPRLSGPQKASRPALASPLPRSGRALSHPHPPRHHCRPRILSRWLPSARRALPPRWQLGRVWGILVLSSGRLLLGRSPWQRASHLQSQQCCTWDSVSQGNPWPPLSPGLQGCCHCRHLSQAQPSAWKSRT